MIDVVSEEIFPLRDLVSRHNLRGRSGKPLHFSAVYRWSNSGLEWLLVGGVRYTSDAAFQQFCEARTAARSGQAASPVVRQPASRRRAIEKADRELAALGL